MKADQYIKDMWHYFGIMIIDKYEYRGFVKKSGGYYEIYIPVLDCGKIKSFKYEDCKIVQVSTLADVKQYLKRNKTYLLELNKAMEMIKKHE